MTAGIANTDRRALLKGLFGKSSAKAEIRPPGAVQEDLFTELCDRCDLCIPACPEKIVTRGDGGFPALDFSRVGCTACGQCSKACPTGALAPSAGTWPAAYIQITESCLAYSGISCQACKDSCDHRAIQFPITRSVPLPEMHAQICIGCGECIGVCPNQSITAHPVVT